MNIEEKCVLVGQRLKSARLEKNLTQSEISKIAGISRGRVVEAEKGFATLETILSILSALKREDELDLLLSEIPAASITNLKRSKKLRRRASGNQMYLDETDFPGA